MQNVQTLAEIKGWNTPNADEANVVDFQGGKLCIPEADHELFLESFAAQAANRNDQHLTQRRQGNGPFPFYIDMDVPSSIEFAAPSKDWFIDLVRHIVRAIELCYPDSEDLQWKQCLVTMAKATRVTQDKSKLGWHFHFPQLIVTIEQANDLYALIVSQLNRTFPLDEAAVPKGFVSLLDACVYTGGRALRLPYSKKMQKCPVCNGKPQKVDELCPRCHRNKNGKISEPRSYVPYLLLHHNGIDDVDWINSRQPRSDEDRRSLTEITKHYIEVVKLCSVWTQKLPNAYFRRSDQCPPAMLISEVTKGRSKKRKTPPEEISLVAHTVSNSGGSSRKLENKNILDAIEKIVKNTLPKIYQDIVISSVHPRNRNKHATQAKGSRSGDDYYGIRVTGSGSSYCHRVKRAHNSNHIFFKLRPHCIEQCCYSSTEDHRGTCKNYSHAWPVENVAEQIRICFPDCAKTAKETSSHMCRCKFGAMMENVIDQY